MKTKHTLFLLILIISQLLFSQQKWSKTFGENNRYDITSKIIQTYDGGSIIASIYYYQEGELWYCYGWLIKTDANGNQLWDKVIDFPERHYFKLNEIAETYDHGLVIVGWVGTETVGVTYPIAFKLSACMAVEWCNVYIDPLGAGSPSIKDIVELSDHSLILLSNNYGEANIEDAGLFKLNSNGELLWQKVICSGYQYPTLDVLPYNILKDSLDNIFIASGGYWENYIHPIAIKTDSEGNEIWVSPIGVGEQIGDPRGGVLTPTGLLMYGYGKYQSTNTGDWTIQLDHEGNVVDDVLRGPYEINPNFTSYITNHAQLMKNGKLFMGGGWGYDGMPNWSSPPSMIGTIAIENLFDYDLIYEDSIVNNNLFAIGQQHQLTKDSTQILSTYDIPETNGSTRDIYFTKYNSDLSEAPIDNTPYLYDTACPFGIQSGFIVLDQCVPVSTKETPNPNEYYAHLKTIPINIYPNPANHIAKIELENTEHHNNITLEITDLMGKKISQQKIQKSQIETTINVESWERGIYFVVVKSEGEVVGRAKLVVQ